MNKPKIPALAPSRWDSDVRLLAWLATCVSVISFLYYLKRGEVLLYGDAVAHINIARRVFDSKTPGLLQLGTVWLPLPHLLMVPFLVSDRLWRTGLGGSIPSLVAYVFGVVGIFRLVRGCLSSRPADPSARAAAWMAALVYGANPNLIYMQSTAMGESLYLALFIWSLVYFQEAILGESKALLKCGFCLAGACLTRYDGWFLAAVLTATVLTLWLRARFTRPDTIPAFHFSRLALAKFVLLAALGPALWLIYNGIVYRNPLEFENGPYSAKAIERRTQASGTPGHPGSGNVIASGQYFLKAAQVNISETPFLQRLWVFLAIAAFAAITFRIPRSGTLLSLALLCLLIPLPFYALSIAYGGVPIFIPPWWPFTHYNVRYGLQILPAFSVAIAILVHLGITSSRWHRRFAQVAILPALAFVIVSYASIWRAGPISLKEAQLNMRGRHELETRVAAWLQQLPPDSTLLMFLGDHVGALQQAGIPLRRVINEGNHRVWKQPADPQGLWEHALEKPSQYADYVIAFEGDDVWRAMQGQHAQALVEIHVTGQALAILYRAR